MISGDLSPHDNVYPNQLHLDESLPLPAGAIYRDLTASDIDAFVNFDDKSFFDSETPTDHRPPNLTHEEVAEGLERSDIIRGIYDSEGNFLAAMWLQPDEENRDMYVYSLNVSPKQRDSGIGSFFLREANKEAISRRYDSCSLHVDPLNSRGIYLYTKNGYKVESYETETEHGLNDWLILRKELNTENQTLEGGDIIIETGDEEGLRRTLALGAIGTKVLLDEGRNPRKNKIVFASSAEKTD